MSKPPEIPTNAVSHYAKAYATHYGERDMLTALRAYARVIEEFPRAPEAEYARAQIGNIVHLVVPTGELIASQIDLGLRHLERHQRDLLATAAP